MIFVVGGYTAEHHGVPSSARVDGYDTSVDTWTRKADMLKARMSPGVGVYGDALYVIGGTANGSVVSSMEWYNYDNNSWHCCIK